MNLRSGKHKGDNIILNLCVDFHEQTITRNSRLNGEWGEKENDENLFDRKNDKLNPIVPGKNIYGRISNCIHFFSQMVPSFHIWLFYFQAKYSNFIFYFVIKNFILL